MTNGDGRTDGQTKRSRGRKREERKYGHGLRRNMCLIVNNKFFHEKFAVVFYWFSNSVGQNIVGYNTSQSRKCVLYSAFAASQGTLLRDLNLQMCFDLLLQVLCQESRVPSIKNILCKTVRVYRQCSH